jgi:hypothetical protein
VDFAELNLFQQGAGFRAGGRPLLYRWPNAGIEKITAAQENFFG